MFFLQEETVFPVNAIATLDIQEFTTLEFNVCGGKTTCDKTDSELIQNSLHVILKEMIQSSTKFSWQRIQTLSQTSKNVSPTLQESNSVNSRK
jgi:hypothetical protein